MSKPRIQEPLILPDPTLFSDQEIMRMGGREFGQYLVKRAETWAREVTDPEKFEIRELEEEERRRALISWTERHAWMEWWFGVPVPAKQIVLLPNQDFPIKLLLSQQIIDEVKHQRILSRRAASLGGSARIERYVPEPEVVSNAPEKMTESDSPMEIAAALQCTGEVIINENTTHRSVLFRLLDEETKRAFTEEIAPDEQRHIEVGIKIMDRHATTPEARRRAARIQNRKFRSTYSRYLVDLAGLGATRVGPEPVVDGESAAA